MDNTTRPGTGIAAPGAVADLVAIDDSFALLIPDGVAVAEATVLAPSGVLLSCSTLTAAQFTRLVTLKARPAQGYVVRPSDDARLGGMPRLTCRVIDRRGVAVPGGVPVVLWRADGAGVAMPLLAVETQSGGYFGGPGRTRPLYRIRDRRWERPDADCAAGRATANEGNPRCRPHSRRLAVRLSRRPASRT